MEILSKFGNAEYVVPRPTASDNMQASRQRKSFSLKLT